MKILSRISLILIVLLLLTSCFNTNVNNTNDNSINYLEELKNYEVKKKNIDNTVDNQEFEEFLDNIFIESISDSYLYLHNSVSDYTAMSIEKPEVSFGDIKYNDIEALNEYIEDLNSLKEYDYETLSYRQQYDYDLLEYSYLETIAYASFDKYNLLFSQGNDLVGNLVITLDEFNFYDEESVEDYLILLKDVERYLSDALVYTEEQTKDHIYTSKSSIEYTTDYIDSFISKVEDNSLINSFSNRLDNLDLTENKKEEYLEQDEDLIINSIIPAFKGLKEGLNKLKTKSGSDSVPLCELDQEYAEITFMINVSTNDSVEEMFNDTETVLLELQEKFETALSDQDAINEYYSLYESKVGGFGLSDEETLKYLESKIGEYYPSLKEYKYTLSRLDESSASDSIIAYYVSPPLDNLSLNVIRTNPNAMGYDVVDDYVTLAHEGFPGHLYQNIYFQSTNPNRFRATQNFIGYDEGYACKAMIDALKFSGVKNENTLVILEYTTIFGYLIDSLVDMGVNYYGWSKRDTKKYINSLGLTDIVYYEDLYQSAIDRPGVLDEYGVGYVEFVKLENKAKEALGLKFNEIEFNEELIKHGPLPFNILEESIDSYIESKN